MKTNFEILMSCTSPKQFQHVYEKFGYGCVQTIARKNGTDVEVWKKRCLSPEYRGKNGCEKCKAEFWEQEFMD